jgi:nucleolar protein 6
MDDFVLPQEFDPRIQPNPRVQQAFLTFSPDHSNTVKDQTQTSRKRKSSTSSESSNSESESSSSSSSSVQPSQPVQSSNPSSSTTSTEAKQKRKRKRKEKAPNNSESKQSTVNKQSTNSLNHSSSSSVVRPSSVKSRYILFVGNLPYRCSSDDLKQYFHSLSINAIRLPTDKDTNKPSGYAFVEFSDAISLQKALKYHHMDFKGRKINVELTAGGGGNSEKRKEKIKAKREKLNSERKVERENKKGNQTQIEQSNPVVGEE